MLRPLSTVRPSPCSVVNPFRAVYGTHPQLGYIIQQTISSAPCRLQQQVVCANSIIMLMIIIIIVASRTHHRAAEMANGVHAAFCKTRMHLAAQNRSCIEAEAQSPSFTVNRL